MMQPLEHQQESIKEEIRDLLTIQPQNDKALASIHARLRELVILLHKTSAKLLIANKV
jgi:hypothetical protein